MIEVLRKRRSIRIFTDQKIEAEKMTLLREALLRSPTSRNNRSWEFIIIDDLDIIQRLSKVRGGLRPLETATCAVVVCGDETKSDVWVEDCSIASIVLQLTAVSLGLGSCWGQIRLRNHDKTQSAERFVQEDLNIPAHLRVEAIIALGYPAEDKASIPLSELLSEKIHHNRYA
ncbi:MAG: nitroreductase family protein [Candidatus Bathyarchaeota archaeon]|nr:MAG: nitroreductase family protein [Candidatus Bathyarchaeota archaeon]